MSQVAKVLQVLDLFSASRPTLAAEEIADLLAISRPTAFRYVKQLCETGLLAKLAGRYALGAKIIALDYRIRRSEPILQASRPRMRALAEQTGATVVLCGIYGDEIVHSHHEASGKPAAMSLERGRVMPLFRGAAPAVILAHLSSTRLKQLYERHHDDPAVAHIAPDWPALRAHYQRIRKNGFYVSREEIDAGVVGIAAPIFNDGRHVVGAVTLVRELDGSEPADETAAIARITTCATHITVELARLAN
ncbi:Transcriptional regulator KdgR [Pigmentiphaga humi]|uniref:Transcriptional regulator KdgR n=1 Tax=Pigmentiphaga humi TaxID=2478468 RepID=A0A3P4AZW6_9BURK|nr:IclR family transcriptional regulator [Pigmentiphaga humi]VCU69111.1 Transcriptional regulator KdgR [Pigmentiphaga humi]